MKKKLYGIGDPLKQFGLFTMNKQIPYKKPVLKQSSIFVNARGVIHEIETKHGGLYFSKGPIDKRYEEQDSYVSEES